MTKKKIKTRESRQRATIRSKNPDKSLPVDAEVLGVHIINAEDSNKHFGDQGIVETPADSQSVSTDDSTVRKDPKSDKSRRSTSDGGRPR
jgi:hypothetical protein